MPMGSTIICLQTFCMCVCVLFFLHRFFFRNVELLLQELVNILSSQNFISDSFLVCIFFSCCFPLSLSLLSNNSSHSIPLIVTMFIFNYEIITGYQNLKSNICSRHILYSVQLVKILYKFEIEIISLKKRQRVG